MTTAAIYVRVSSAGQEDNTSLESQEAACRAYAAEHGYTIDPAHIYREVHTGTELFERSRLRELLDAVSRRDVAAVICYAIDRLSRNQDHLAYVLVECDRAGVAVEFVTEALDSTPEGALLRAVRGYVGRIEHMKITMRTQGGRLARVRGGAPLGCNRARYGYQWADADKRRYVVDEPAAAIVRRIYARALAGVPMRRIAIELTDDGIPSPAGLPHWTLVTVHNILKDRSYIGEFIAFRHRWWKPKSGVYVRPEPMPLPDVAPAIIEPAAFERVQEKLTRNKQFASRRNARPEASLLRGMVRCAHCGRSMSAINATGRPTVYLCGSRRLSPTPCTGHAADAARLDAEVWADLVKRLTDRPFLESQIRALAADEPAREDLTAVDRALTDIDRRLAQLADVIAEETIPSLRERHRSKYAELESQRVRLAAEREVLRGQRDDWTTAMQQVEGVARWADALGDTLTGMTYAERREVLEQVNIGVTVERAPHRGGRPQWHATADLPIVDATVFPKSDP